jgi:aminoglycoside phosphotransferase (APT) family kinase protein
MSDVIVAPQVRELESLSQDLAAWAAGRLGAAKDVRVENLTYPRGAGRSHETVLFDLSWSQDGRRTTQGCVVRIKPIEKTVYPDDLYLEQYHVMRTLHEHGQVRVAKIFWLEEDPAILGAPFFVMEKLNGRVPVSVPPYSQSGWVTEATPEQRTKMWREGVRQLALIQTVPLSLVPFLAGPEGARSGLEQEWDKFMRFHRWISQDRRWPPIEEAIRRLERNWPKNQPEGMVWGDARIGNMMFNDDFEVVAVMDWEQPSLGGALNDLAWWLYMAKQWERRPDGSSVLEGFATREEIIALWREVCGKPTDDLEWYDAFTALKVACLGIRTMPLWGMELPTEADLVARLGL